MSERDLTAEAVTLLAQQPMSKALGLLVNEWIEMGAEAHCIMGAIEMIRNQYRLRITTEILGIIKENSLARSVAQIGESEGSHG